MSDEGDSKQLTVEDAACAARTERAKHLGIGVGFLIAGSGMIARLLGWTKTDADLLLPAILIGVAVYYLYRAIGR